MLNLSLAFLEAQFAYPELKVPEYSTCVTSLHRLILVCVHPFVRQDQAGLLPPVSGWNLSALPCPHRSSPHCAFSVLEMR